jgi:phosphatidylserine decarboxylase
MEISEIIALIGLIGFASVLAPYFFWRHIWFFRNPVRDIPNGDNVVSPADGTIVYVKGLPSKTPIVSIKNNKRISISDIVREDLHNVNLLIGIFMSPFDVHYNRAPIAGKAEFIRHHPANFRNHHMGSMHWRSIFKRFPIYEKSPHIIDNERLVTKIEGLFKGRPISCYVVQIAGGSVNGIDSFVNENSFIEKGSILGMIRIGSQVDIVVTWHDSMTVKVKPGQKVFAGETILVE